MRKDMHKLLCERPRNGHKDRDRDREIPARRYSQRLELVRGEDEDGEYVESNSPSSMKMGKGWTGGGTKELNENLNPLYRWLDKQVNRPWDKVYSELRQRIDVRSAVQLHIMEHLWDRVERDVEIVDGVACAKMESWEGRWRSGQLYVNPETGILCKAKVKSKSKGYKQDPRVIKVDDLTFLCQIKGIWYEVTYSHKPPKGPFINRVWCKNGGYKDTDEVVLKFEAQYRNLSDLEKRAYKSWWIPFAKVQLSSKDLRKRGLQNQAAA